MVRMPDLFLTHLDLAKAAWPAANERLPLTTDFGASWHETFNDLDQRFPGGVRYGNRHVEWEFTGVLFDATEKIARTLLFMTLATLCVSCRTDNQLGSSQATPVIDSSEMSAREIFSAASKNTPVHSTQPRRLPYRTPSGNR